MSEWRRYEEYYFPCESPIAMSEKEVCELYDIADSHNCILMESIRTAYLTAYSRMLLLLKSGIIGKVISVDSTCTSLTTQDNFGVNSPVWGAFETWGSTAMLPVLQILGTNYNNAEFFSIPSETAPNTDGFTRMVIEYDESTATIKVGTNVKSEGELIISGTNGYIIVPAPWWKTDYFEARFEESNKNRRFFYQVEGEGIRYELVEFAAAVSSGKSGLYISREITKNISRIIDEYRSYWRYKNGNKKL